MDKNPPPFETFIIRPLGFPCLVLYDIISTSSYNTKRLGDSHERKRNP
jgi:hypothetical protein